MLRPFTPCPPIYHAPGKWNTIKIYFVLIPINVPRGPYHKSNLQLQQFKTTILETVIKFKDMIFLC